MAVSVPAGSGGALRPADLVCAAPLPPETQSRLWDRFRGELLRNPLVDPELWWGCWEEFLAGARSPVPSRVVVVPRQCRVAAVESLCGDELPHNAPAAFEWLVRSGSLSPSDWERLSAQWPLWAQWLNEPDPRSFLPNPRSFSSVASHLLCDAAVPPRFRRGLAESLWLTDRVAVLCAEFVAGARSDPGSDAGFLFDGLPSPPTRCTSLTDHSLLQTLGVLRPALAAAFTARVLDAPDPGPHLLVAATVMAPWRAPRSTRLCERLASALRRCGAAPDHSTALELSYLSGLRCVPVALREAAGQYLRTHDGYVPPSSVYRDVDPQMGPPANDFLWVRRGLFSRRGPRVARVALRSDRDLGGAGRRLREALRYLLVDRANRVPIWMDAEPVPVCPPVLVDVCGASPAAWLLAVELCNGELDAGDVAELVAASGVASGCGS